MLYNKAVDLQQISWKRILEEIQSYSFIPSKDTDFLQLLTTEQIKNTECCWDGL